MGLLGVDRAQLGDHRGLDRDGGFQIGIGGRDRGLQDKRSSPLAHGPYNTATPAAIPWSNRTRHGEREALNSYAAVKVGQLTGDTLPQAVETTYELGERAGGADG